MDETDPGGRANMLRHLTGRFARLGIAVGLTGRQGQDGQGIAEVEYVVILALITAAAMVSMLLMMPVVL